MKIPFSHFRNSLRRRAGFTMIEIAIALGVIAFALVAIIGILPMGMQVQRDNRAETIIVQDATFWMDAIKSGAEGLDDLVRQVDRIDIHFNYKQPGPPETTVTYRNFKSGWEIIGLLTTPAWTNAEVYASVWGMSGSASEKEPDPTDRVVAFKYRLHVTIEPAIDNAVSFVDQVLPPPPNAPYQFPLNSLHDIRLSLAYPLVRDDAAPNLQDMVLPRRQVARSAVNAHVVTIPSGSITYAFFKP